MEADGLGSGHQSEDSATLIGAHQAGKRTRAAPEAALIHKEFGEWLSLVEHLVRDQGVGGSNPLSPTIKSKQLRDLLLHHGP